MHAVGAMALATLMTLGCGTLTGCSAYRGLNSVVLPGDTGTGDGSYIITAEFDTASNLVANAEVKVNDVTVGTVRSITLEGWHASMSLGLRGDVILPANTVAKIGQKSLLGASYVGLSPPPAPEHATGQLRDGDLIPLTRTAKYPETEELLATLSLWLNDGGLAQVHTITSELNKALGGNEQNVRELLQNLDVFTGTLNAQRGQIVSTVESLDRLAVTLSARGDELGGAIDKIEPGLRVLNEQREPLTDALKALDRLSVVGDRTLDHSGDAVRADLHHLRPVLHRLGVAGDDLPDSLDALLTVFMPVTAIPSFLKGDYASASATIDLTAPSMTSGVVPSTAADKVAGGQGGTSPASDLLTGLLTNTVTGGSPPPSPGPPGHGSAPSPENSGMGGLMNELGGG